MKKLLQSVKIPHVFIFLSFIIFVASVFTYIIPSGTYDRKVTRVDGIERTLVVPGSYKQLPKHFSVKAFILGDRVEGMATPTSVLGLFSSIPKGMNQAASLIFFVFIIGAVFNLIQHTGTINVVMFHLMHLFRNVQILLFLGIYSAIFLAASFLGMGAEFIPLIPLFLLIARQTGYDRMFGIALFIVPMTIGWTAALTNPFNLQIAQKVAELPLSSGMGLRLLLFVVCFTGGFLYLIWYGRKVKRDPERSLMKGDKFEIKGLTNLKKDRLSPKHVGIILSSMVLFALILYAVQTMGWGLIEMSGGFFMVGLCTILISGMSGDESMVAFVNGLKTMIVPALIIGFARGIQVVMMEAQIVDTLLYTTSGVLEKQTPVFAAEGMLYFQTLLNFFIPSASGQALVSMPLMVPLADLLNISRQSAVLAFVMGDGFSNIIIPTSGQLMAILGIAGVAYEKWFKFVFPLFLLMMLIASIFMAVAIASGY